MRVFHRQMNPRRGHRASLTESKLEALPNDNFRPSVSCSWNPGELLRSKSHEDLIDS